MKLIYLIAGTYRPAGMERVLTVKANWFAARDNTVVIVTTDQRGRRPAYPLDGSIVSYDLDINYEENNGASFLNKLFRYPFKQFLHRRRLAALLRRERADIVVSMFCNDASFLPRIKDCSRKVLEIHFSRYKRLQYGRTGLWAVADRLRSRNDRRVASRFDRFVVLTDEDRGYWEQEGQMPNLCVIPNARTFFRPKEQAPADCHRTVLAVGRYNVQKAFDRLIDAWAVVQQAVTDGDCPEGWVLRIVGDGELREEMTAQIHRLGLDDSILLGAAESDMYQVYANADIYAMTSRYEGLPMVLLEAQAMSLPIVSMTCRCGPRDVVTDGADGFLVQEGDIRAMAKRLVLLMSDAELRHSMSQAARAASDRYDIESVMSKWECLFDELMKEHA